uniref:Uncharacterized protein n=1 Tax=Anopheles christyi TaxID=43041 RepID=A0A182JSC3_9DIPT
MASKELVLDQLNTFIDESEYRINSIFESLNWGKESVLGSQSTKHNNGAEKEKNRTNTIETFPVSFQPSDSSSTISLGKRALGSIGSNVIHKSNLLLILDNIKQAEAILEEVYRNPSFELGVPLEKLVDRGPPSSIADLHVNFTREERLSIYQHVLKNTTKPPDVPEIKIRYYREFYKVFVYKSSAQLLRFLSRFKRDTRSEEKATSLPAIAAIERDARRRNPKHRVSRNPLTYSEKVRHLIQVQTDALAHHFRQDSRAAEVDDRTSMRNKSKPKSRSKSPEPGRSKKTKTKHIQRPERPTSPAPDRGHRKRTRHRSRSRERSTSQERKRHKSHKKHKKKHDR